MGDETHGTRPFKAVSGSKSFAANPWHGHLTYLWPLTGFMDMLNSCGHALSQGDGSEFHPRWEWEATPPSYRACVRAWRRLAPRHGATPAQTSYGSPVKLEEKGMLAGVTDCRRIGGVGNGAAKEDGRWDLNLGTAAIERENHEVLKQVDRERATRF